MNRTFLGVSAVVALCALLICCKPAQCQTYVATSWSSPVAGNWSDGTKWTNGTPLDANYDVTINLAASPYYRVWLDVDPTVHNLTMNAPGARLDLLGRTLTIDGRFDLLGGSLRLYNSTIRGGEFNLSGGTLEFIGGTTSPIFDGVSVVGDLSLPDRSFLKFAGGTSVAGDIYLTGSALTLGQDFVVSDKTITLRRQSYNGTITIEDGMTLTVDATGLILGSNSTITGSATGRLTNNGVIRSDESGKWLTLSAPVFDNNGSLEVVNGGHLNIWNINWGPSSSLLIDNSIVNFRGNYTVAGLGTSHWNRTGGTVRLVGSIDNTGTTLDFAQTGPVVLNGVTITGGTLTNLAGNVTLNKLTLDGLHYPEPVVFAAGSGNYLELKNGATFAGDLSGSGQLILDQDMTLSGKSLSNGQIILKNDHKVILDETTAVSGAGGMLFDDEDIPGGSKGEVENRGTISSTGGDVDILVKRFTNKGAISAPNASINAGGYDTEWMNEGTLSAWAVHFKCRTTTAGLGMSGWQRSGNDKYYLQGTLDNTGSVLDVSSAGRVYLSGTVVGGIIVPSDNLILNSPTFTNATYAGDLVIQNTCVLLGPGGTVAGNNILLSGSPAALMIDGDTTIEKHIVLGGYCSYLEAWAEHKLVLGPNSDIEASSGLFTLYNPTGHIAKAQMENQGHISVDGSLSTTNDIETFTNSGSIDVVRGEFNMYSQFIQTGGRLNVDSRFIFQPSVSNPEFRGGVISGTGSLMVVDQEVRFLIGAAAIEPGHSAGTLGIGCYLELSPESQLNFELSSPGVVGSGINDLLDGSGARKGGLTLDGTLNVTALDGFGAGTYRIISYTGEFTDNGLAVGQMPEGYAGVIDTSTAGQVNLVVSEVPEPATLAVLLAGAAALMRRRNR